MMKCLRALAALLGMLVVAGCIESTTIILVKKDGSGLVSETVYMSPAFEKMMQQMMAGFGQMGGEAAKAEKPALLNPEDAKKKAAKMGEGVTFKSAKEVTKKNGQKGQRALYSFTDITKLKISPDPDTPSGPQGGMASQPSKKSNPIAFEFVKGSQPKLVIKMPQSEKPDAPAAAPEMPEMKMDPATMPPEQKAQMEQMKQMFDGFRVRLIVKVDGEIVKSNATHVHKSRKSGKKQLITLMDMDIGKLMDQEGGLMKLMSMGQDQNIVAVAEKMKNIPGLKFEIQERVEVDFK